MGKEIERKFLVVDDSYRAAATGTRHIAQGYLSTDPDRTVRVRVADGHGYITIKTRNRGAVRNEWEYEVPTDDARAMLAACKGRVIAKTRYIVPGSDGLTWEVDAFEGDLAPLTVAEVELPAEDTPVELPPFAGREVTDDPAYFNSALAAQV